MWSEPVVRRHTPAWRMVMSSRTRQAGLALLVMISLLLAGGAAPRLVFASSVGSVTFSGSPQTGGARATWTVGFTNTGGGALAAGDTITVAFNTGFTVPTGQT